MAYNVNIFDLKQWSVWLAGQTYQTTTTKTVKDWCLSENAELCFNLGMFEMSTGKGVTYVRGRKGILGYGGNSYEVGWGINSCKGYSNGIVDGMVLINKPLGGTRTRNGIGITQSGKVIIAQTTHKVTEKAFAQAVNSYCAKRGEAIKTFVLEDGGGSTCEYSSVSKLNCAPEGGRRVTTVVCVSRIGLPPVTRNLKLWSKGEDVRLLQTVLGGIECDGSFGFGTRSRLMQAQKALGLAADGSCGPLTRKALGL